MNKNQAQLNILICLVIVTGVFILSDTEPGLCQTSENWSIQPQVTDSGGGVCNSDNYRLGFSLGQTSPVGVCTSDTQCVSAGFITGVANTAQANETSADSPSNSSRSCFIRSLLPD